MTVESDLGGPDAAGAGGAVAGETSGETVTLTAALVPSFKASRRVIFPIIQYSA